MECTNKVSKPAVVKDKKAIQIIRRIIRKIDIERMNNFNNIKDKRDQLH